MNINKQGIILADSIVSVILLSSFIILFANTLTAVNNHKLEIKEQYQQLAVEKQNVIANNKFANTRKCLDLKYIKERVCYVQ